MDRSYEKEQACQEIRRTPSRLGGPPTISDSVSGRLSSINKQLDNHIQRLGQVYYRLAPACDEVTNAKDPESVTIMQTLDMIQSKLHRLEVLEENIDRLV
jgi:hypothetical protein